MRRWPTPPTWWRSGGSFSPRPAWTSATKNATSKGVYRLTFGSGTHFAAHGVDAFYPQINVVFEVRHPEEHHHVPLLLSPFGYSTYRGSSGWPASGANLLLRWLHVFAGILWVGQTWLFIGKRP